jgi:hypothetical protein
MTMSAGLWNPKRHWGIEFVICNRESAWFWLLLHPRGKGGVIGAARDEAQAMRDARLSIEERLAIS